MLSLDDGLLLQLLLGIIALQAIFSLSFRLKVKGVTEHGTHKADVAAYNLVVFLVNSTCAYEGAKYFLDGTAGALDTNHISRLYATSPEFNFLGTLTAAYEVYNTLAVILVSDYRTFAFVGHHATTLVLALFGFAPSLLHYYGFFFFGIVQISSAPLALAEVCTILDATSLHAASMGVFALSFLVVRSLIWPLVSLRFWRDTMAAMQAGERSLGPLTIYLAANVFLTGLQVVWTRQVVRGLLDALGLGTGGKAVAKKKTTAAAPTKRAAVTPTRVMRSSTPKRASTPKRVSPPAAKRTASPATKRASKKKA